eukprot:1968706-Amphidinium_carterae.2
MVQKPAAPAARRSLQRTSGCHPASTNHCSFHPPTDNRARLPSSMSGNQAQLFCCCIRVTPISPTVGLGCQLSSDCTLDAALTDRFNLHGMQTYLWNLGDDIDIPATKLLSVATSTICMPSMDLLE